MGPEDLSRAVQEEIGTVLDDPSLRGSSLSEAILALGARHGIEPFRAVLASLVRLELREPEARRTLMGAEEHRASLEARLGRDPGLAVAALDRLLEIEGALRDPVFRRAGTAAAAPAPRPLAAAGTEEADASGDLEARRGERFDHPLSVVVLRPDRAEPLSEEEAGAAAAAVREVARDTDQARPVPEGLRVVLPCTAGDEARNAADRLRRTLQVSTGVSWSAGVAATPGEDWDFRGLARVAKEAARAAQARGGDAVGMHRRERRDHPRQRVGPFLAARLRKDGRESDIEIEDLSLGGALVATGDGIPAGSEVVLILRETSARPRQVAIASRVERLDEVPEGPGRPAEAPGAAPKRWRAAVSFQADADARLRIAGLLADLPARGPADGATRA